MSLLTAVLFGTLPAWLASRPDLVPALKQQSGGSHGGRPHLRNAISVVQVGLSLVLTAIGVYGVVRRAQILSLVLHHGLLLATVGVGLGGGIALILSQLVEDQLFGIRPTDPVTFVMVTAMVAAIAILAAAVPAWRASRVDPMHTLRYE